MTTERKIVKTDGRGIIAGDYVNQNLEMTREKWVQDCFPEWGTYLNKEIENFDVKKGTVSLWWCGGPSWVLKTDEGGVFFIDQYCGPSIYTQDYYCGVCAQSGADSINWMRLNPQVIDPWSFKKVDGHFCTHVHQDHCDIYAVQAVKQTTDAMFFAPRVAAEKLRKFEVPENRLTVAKVGESIKLPGAEVEFLMCYDDTAIRTGGGNGTIPYEEAAVSYLFKTSAGNILFLGDTWYNDAYIDIAHKYDIDVALFDMGYNWPGWTDKMTPYDCARLGETLNAKVLIPDHYDNWSNTAKDPELICNQFERIVAENTPEIKTMIMRCGGRFEYPTDKDCKRYSYASGGVNEDFSRSIHARKK